MTHTTNEDVREALKKLQDTLTVEQSLLLNGLLRAINDYKGDPSDFRSVACDHPNPGRTRKGRPVCLKCGKVWPREDEVGRIK